MLSFSYPLPTLTEEEGGGEELTVPKGIKMKLQFSITLGQIKWSAAICDKSAVLLVHSSLPLLQCMFWLLPLFLLWGLKH